MAFDHPIFAPAQSQSKVSFPIKFDQQDQDQLDRNQQDLEQGVDQNDTDRHDLDQHNLNNFQFDSSGPRSVVPTDRNGRNSGRTAESVAAASDNSNTNLSVPILSSQTQVHIEAQRTSRTIRTQSQKIVLPSRRVAIYQRRIMLAIAFLAGLIIGLLFAIIV